MNANKKKYNRSGNSHAGSTVRVITHGYFGADKLSASERVIINALYTFTQKGGNAEFTFREIQRRYNLGYSTVARGIHKILKLCFERADEPHSYRQNTALPIPRYFYIPDWYHHAAFPLGEEMIALTKDQREVLAYIVHQNKHIPHWRTTQAAIARELEIAPSTVSEAVTLLEALNLLTVRSADEHTRSVNHLDRISFTPNSDALEQARLETLQHVKPQKTAVRAADERTDREHFYSSRQKLAQEYPNRVRQILGKEYEELERRLGILGMQLARAEHDAMHQKCEEIRKKQEETNAAMKKCLELHGYTAADLEPRYICPECRDTGWRISDGKLCHCWRPPTGGRQ